MDYSTVLKKLYGNDDYEVLRVLNSAIYVEEYITKEDSFFIHTGFVFFTHKNTQMSLIYDFSTESIIKQVHFGSTNCLPFNGIVLVKAGRGYLYNTNEVYLMVEVNAADSNKSEILALDSSVYNIDKINPKELIAINDKSGEKITIENICIKYESKADETFPFQRNSNTQFYFDGSSFDIYFESDYDEVQDEDQDLRNRESFNRYEGSWAQDIEGMSDGFIDDVFDGEPDAYWNID